MRERTGCASEHKERSYSVGVAGNMFAPVAAGSGRHAKTPLTRRAPALGAAPHTGKARQ
jgi:hypothetical protein